MLSAPVAFDQEVVSESRRALILKIGVAASVALIPLVTSIGVPHASAQQSPAVPLLDDAP